MDEHPALARCLSAGRTMTSFWSTPDGREALAARAMDRAPVYAAMGTRHCDHCHEERPIEGMTFAKGEDTHTEYATCERCGDAMRAAHEASVEAAYREQYGDDYDRLATYQVEGR